MPDKLIVASAHHGNSIALRILNAIRFSVIFHALGFFGVTAVTLQQPFGITFCTQRVENAHVYVWHYSASEVHFYILK